MEDSRPRLSGQRRAAVPHAPLSATGILLNPLGLATSGASIGVKEGGLLDFQVRDLHVECLPNAIPDRIDVDISNLGMHQYLRISDLTTPQGVKVLDDPDRVVVGITHAKAEELPAAPEAAAAEAEAVPTEPEVIPRGKKPEEETEE